MKDYYEVLGLPHSATLQQICRKYRQMALEYHADTTEYPVEWAEERLKAINAAYEVLSHPAKRAAYDAELAGPPPAPKQDNPTTFWVDWWKG